MASFSIVDIPMPFLCLPHLLPTKSMLYLRPSSLQGWVGGGGIYVCKKNVILNSWNCYLKSTRFKQVCQLLLSLILAFPVYSVHVCNQGKKTIFESPFSPSTSPKLRMNKLRYILVLYQYHSWFQSEQGFAFNFIFSKIVTFVIRYVHNGSTAHDVIWLQLRARESFSLLFSHAN